MLFQQEHSNSHTPEAKNSERTSILVYPGTFMGVECWKWPGKGLRIGRGKDYPVIIHITDTIGFQQFCRKTGSLGSLGGDDVKDCWVRVLAQQFCG